MLFARKHIFTMKRFSISLVWGPLTQQHWSFRIFIEMCPTDSKHEMNFNGWLTLGTKLWKSAEPEMQFRPEKPSLDRIHCSNLWPSRSSSSTGAFSTCRRRTENQNELRSLNMTQEQWENTDIWHRGVIMTILIAALLPSSSAACAPLSTGENLPHLQETPSWTEDPEKHQTTLFSF